MRVIICDDEKSTCARLEQMLKEISLEKSMELEIDVFFEGTALTRYLEREAAADILFLDIQFPGEGINGVEVGKYIRETLNNPHMFLVYISSREEYAMELFQNQPFDFLVNRLIR